MKTRTEILGELISNIKDSVVAQGCVLRAAQDTQNAKWESECKAEIQRLSSVLASYEKQLEL